MPENTILLHCIWFTFINFLFSTEVATSNGSCTYSVKTKDQTYLYDLTSLKDNSPWVIEHETESSRLVFYLSVCEPLGSKYPKCDEKSFLCLDKKDKIKSRNVLSRNLGTSLSSKVNKYGDLILTGKNGSVCENNGSKSAYSFTIHFKCTIEESQPEYVSSSSCSPLFIWPTPHACHQSSPEPLLANCSLFIPGLSYSYDLLQFKREDYYKVIAGNRTFEINICGPVKSGHCSDSSLAACEVHTSYLNMTKPLGQSTNQFLSWNDGSISLLYNTTNPLTGNVTSTEIKFVCDKKTETGSLSFLKENKEVFHFEFRSAALCPKSSVTCQLFEDDNFYDLEFLANVDYWKVETMNESTELFISVCHSLQSEAIPGCKGGNVGACLLDSDNNSTEILGLSNTDVKLNSDMSLSLIYTGIKKCHLSSMMTNVKINMICSAEWSHPILVSTDGCTFDVEWKTPSACPLHLYKGQNCIVEDKAQNVVYNLQALRKNNDDYMLDLGDTQFIINICGPLNKQCNGNQQSSVCKVDKNKQTSYGKASQELEYKDASLSLRYSSGDKCGKDVFSSQIIFLCSYATENNAGPEFITEQDCTAYFLWRTPLACPPLRSMSCSVTQNGKFYDFSPLILHDNNYVYLSYDKKTKYILNICRNIYPTSGARCEHSSSVCQINLEKKNPKDRYVSGGSLQNEFIVRNGHPSLEYKMGSPCGPDKWTTVIEFKCNQDVEVGQPKLVDVSNCTFHFLWETKTACPIMFPISNSHCKLYDNNNFTVIDLSQLFMSNSEYRISKNDQTYLINICGAVHSDKCRKDAGVCVIDSGQNHNVYSGGIANGKLKLKDRLVFLEYTDGSSCGSGHYSSIIQFLCPTLGQSGAYLISHEDCNIWINWYTPLVCKASASCVINYQNRSVDLSALASQQGGYTLKSRNNQKFFINICSPLKNINGLDSLSHPFAASIEGNGNQKTSLSWGSKLSHVKSYKEKVELLYTEGSKCPQYNEKRLSSKIQMYCSQSNSEKIQLISTSDCQLVVKFGTDLLCNHHAMSVEVTQSCEAIFPQLGLNFDLSPLKNSNGYWVGFGPESFCLTICDHHSTCPGEAAVTRMSFGKNNTFGLTDKGTFVYDSSQLKIHYIGPSCPKRPGENKSADIIFECDPNASGNGYAGLSVFGVYDCTAIFNWKTSLVCLNVNNNTVTTTGETDPENCEGGHCGDSVLSKGAVAGVIMGILGVGLVTVVVLAARKREFAARLFGISNPRSHFRGVRYTRVSADEPDEDSLLLGRNISEDDTLINA